MTAVLDEKTVQSWRDGIPLKEAVAQKMGRYYSWLQTWCLRKWTGPQCLWWNVDLMTSVVAAIVALGAGSVVAAFLYLLSAKFPWDLALLRLVWT